MSPKPSVYALALSIAATPPIALANGKKIDAFKFPPSGALAQISVANSTATAASFNLHYDTILNRHYQSLPKAAERISTIHKSA